VKYGVVFSVSEKKEVCAYTDQFPAAFQQNILNHFSYYKKTHQLTLYGWYT